MEKKDSYFQYLKFFYRMNILNKNQFFEKYKICVT